MNFAPFTMLGARLGVFGPDCFLASDSVLPLGRKPLPWSGGRSRRMKPEWQEFFFSAIVRAKFEIFQIK